MIAAARLTLLGPLLAILSGCGLVSSATSSGIKPILDNGMRAFIEETDLALAEAAIAGNAKLLEGIVATYPDDRELLLLAAMARGSYAFAFLQDDLEAVRLAYPDDASPASQLVPRIIDSYRIARRYAERALASNDAWAEAIGGRRLEAIGTEDLKRALAALGPTDASSLFWVTFAWGGALQVAADPVDALQLPKIALMIERVLALDETVFYGIGGHLLAGVFYGSRAPALGGDPDAARDHFARAKALGGVLIPDVLRAELVDAQIEDQASFERTLTAVIAARPRDDRALLEGLAKRKACRLLANVDRFFLTDPKPPPEACSAIPHKHRLRAASPSQAITAEGLNPRPSHGARTDPSGPSSRQPEPARLRAEPHAPKMPVFLVASDQSLPAAAKGSSPSRCPRDVQ